MFDGRRCTSAWRPTHACGSVDYFVETAPDRLAHGVQARIIAGETLGRDPGCCVVTLVVWRGARQTPESWARTYHAFRTEVHLIEGRVEGLLPWPLDVPAGGVGGVVPAAG